MYEYFRLLCGLYFITAISLLNIVFSEKHPVLLHTTLIKICKIFPLNNLAMPCKSHLQNPTLPLFIPVVQIAASDNLSAFYRNRLPSDLLYAYRRQCFGSGLFFFPLSIHWYRKVDKTCCKLCRAHSYSYYFFIYKEG